MDRKEDGPGVLESQGAAAAAAHAEEVDVCVELLADIEKVAVWDVDDCKV